MAKKVPITKVLSCFVVFVILMSTFSVAVLATKSSNSTASNDSPLNYVNTSSLDPINESVEVPDPNLPVLNDTDISTAKTVSSLGYCSYVWIEITDKYCKGYEVYVNGLYQFTEGESGTPDGYCRFKVTPGYHTFKLTLNGKEVSKGWNCQCGTGYNWMSMNDMIPHWCEGGGNDNPTDEYEVKFRGTVTSTTPSEYDCGFKDVYICEVKIEKVVSGDYFEKGDIVNIVYSQWRENAHVCGTYDKVSVGDTVDVYGEMIPIYCVGTWITICGKNSYYLKKISSESLSISVWTDKSEYKIGETVTINYQTNKKCTAKLTITKPDGGDVVYGPNEIPASTRSKSATAGYPTGERTVVFEAWAGDEYKRATCYFNVVGAEKEVTFRGTVTYTEYSELYEWKVKVDKWINGYISCNVVDVILGGLGQQGSCDTTIRADDYVEIYGKVNEYRNCGVDLNGKSSYYIKKLVEKKPDLIIQDISWSPSNPKQEDTMTFYVYIKNQGSGSAGTSTVKYYIDGSYIASDSVPGLSAGSTTTQTFTWTADKCGNVQVKAVADATNVVIESNEGNNQKIETVNVVCLKKQVHNINTGKDFSSIQAAINDFNTSPGHTITVDPGTCNENVDVTKSLTIRSTSGNPADTIVQAKDPNDHVFEVTADYVNISGFTVQGVTDIEKAGIYLRATSCKISNNICSDNNYEGIYLYESTNNIITNNTCKNNGEGIRLQFSNANFITKNNLSDNNYGGILLCYSDNNIITKNNCSVNNNGIYLWYSISNTVANNAVLNNNIRGILCLHASNNDIINNNCSENDYGIDLDESLNNMISLNNFINNGVNSYSADSTNIWNSTETITYTYKGSTYTNYLGNYWDDYIDVDANYDGIWDNPRSIDGDKDNYPLVGRFENYVSVEEKPEIKFIGTYLYVFNPMGFNAYHFSVDKVLEGKDIAGDEAQIIISEVDETPEAIRKLKEGDKVEIYGKVKNYYEGAWNIDIEGNGYYIKRRDAPKPDTDNWLQINHDEKNTRCSMASIPKADEIDKRWENIEINEGWAPGSISVSQPLIVGNKAFVAVEGMPIESLKKSLELIAKYVITGGSVSFGITDILDFPETLAVMVYCIDVNNGDILWVGVSTGDSVAMAIEDNKLYLAIGGMATASEDILNQPSGIYCVNINNFELEWENKDIKPQCLTHVLTVANNRLFVESEIERHTPFVAAHISCLDTRNKGKVLWSFEGATSGMPFILGPPAVTENKVIYSTYSGDVFCLNIAAREDLARNGDPAHDNLLIGDGEWRYDELLGGGILKTPSSPVICDGEVFITDSLYTRCLDFNTGKEKWKVYGEGDCNPPAVFDGKVYVKSDGILGILGDKICCLDTTKEGAKIWETKREIGRQYSSPVIAGGMVITFTKYGDEKALKGFNRNNDYVDIIWEKDIKYVDEFPKDKCEITHMDDGPRIAEGTICYTFGFSRPHKPYISWGVACLS